MTQKYSFLDEHYIIKTVYAHYTATYKAKKTIQILRASIFEEGESTFGLTVEYFKYQCLILAEIHD